MSERRTILTFHGLGTPPPHLQGGELTVWVDRDTYEATLDAVKGRGDVLITFDDGNRSDVEIALPALRERGLSATFFIVAGWLDRPGFVSRDELRELVEAGMTVGSHGLDHVSWRALPDHELESHLGQARSILEDVVGRPVTEASCPFGEYDRRVLRHLRGLGHERVYTSDGGPARPGAWLQARNTVHSDWDPRAAVADVPEPLRTRVVRNAKRMAKRWR